MKLLFAGIIFLVGTHSFAQDLNFSEYRRFLMNGTNGTGPKMAIQTTCTTATGQIYRIGDKGYDTCLSAVKNQKDSSTATIHIGK